MWRVGTDRRLPRDENGEKAGESWTRPCAPFDLGSPPPLPPLIDVVVEVMKVGQYPKPSIEIPPALEKNLGKESADCYKRALICRNTGFGLAAAGYMRRVV